jgi:O-methyltransferase involved in polyketide biosynthesis
MPARHTLMLCTGLAVSYAADLLAVIDPTRPVAVILGAVLHFLNADTARAVTTGYARELAPGSCLIISVARCDDESLGKRLAAKYTAATWQNHSPADIELFFAGLRLVGPGVTEVQTWRAWLPEPVLRRRDGHVLAGVGRVMQEVDQ